MVVPSVIPSPPATVCRAFFTTVLPRVMARLLSTCGSACALDHRGSRDHMLIRTRLFEIPL